MLNSTDSGPGPQPDGLPANVAIRVRNLSKMYRLYDKPQDRLKQSLFWRLGRSYGREFWALKDVSFDIEYGDSVGIIGRNGSGKSTLLQIIAGTLQPTAGYVQRQGRLSALLELGSGFNPEYTGRENVFLSGAIAGISRSEMENRFDAVASFADIGEFLDQPVKSYSSGMFARLAFSVAISVEPDILIVDEILAVGDYGFQQKCIGRLRQMRDRGLTLLFVSHSPDTVKSVCSKGLFLIDGQQVFWGGVEPAVNRYFEYIRKKTNEVALEHQSDLGSSVRFERQLPGEMRYGTGHVQVAKVQILDADGLPCKAFALGDLVSVSIELEARISTEHLSLSFLVRDLAGIDLLGTTTFDENIELPALTKGQRGRVSFRFQNLLRPGNYGVSIAVNRVSHKDYSDSVLFDQIDAATTFVVLANPARPVHYKIHCPVEVRVDFDGSGSSPHSTDL